MRNLNVLSLRGENEGKKFNVVVVDWGKLASASFWTALFYYPQAVQNVARVGEHVANFIKFLLDAEAICSLGKVHLLGFSLGAHVAGVAGMYLKNKTGIKVGRITGFDPAGPEFGEDVKPNYRLDKEDADFVDVIHSNAGNLGTDLLSGHVDFFVNGGTEQPGCSYDSK